jgi:serine phosphatase RsbU (regulator of sigma subunit)
MTYACAGHPPPMLRHADASIEELTHRGLPLGLRSHEEPSVTLRLNEGDLLILYTDGLIESTHDVFDGLARLRAAIQETQPSGDRDLARTIASRALRNGSIGFSSDDIAVLTVQLRPVVADDLQARRHARSVQGTPAFEENRPV